MRQVRGKWDDNKWEQVYPQAEMDLIATLLVALWEAMQPYVRPRCLPSRNQNRPPRSITDVHRFIQNKHAQVRAKLVKAASGVGRPLFDLEFLDVEVVRSVANDMVSLFVWEWDVWRWDGVWRLVREKPPPKNVWRWDGVWLYPYERDTILAVCMRNFLSVGQREINSAAEHFLRNASADGN